MKIYPLKSYTQKFIQIIISINCKGPNIERYGEKFSIKRKAPVVGDRLPPALQARARGLASPRLDSISIMVLFVVFFHKKDLYFS